MSGPNPPGQDSAGDELEAAPESLHSRPPEDVSFPEHFTEEIVQGADFPSQAYSAPESEQFSTGPYVPADPHLYDYDSYSRDDLDDAPAPRWPWVVGITAIVAAIALVVSVSILVTSTDTDTVATQTSTTTTPAPTTAPFQDEITTTTPPPPLPPPPTSEEAPAPAPPATETVTVSVPPPPEPTAEAPPAETSEAPPVTTTATTTAPAAPRQVTYMITGTKAPGDIVNVTYIDASGRERTQRNVYIPWSLTVTPISNSEVGSVQAFSVFLVSRLNCSITTSDGVILASNNGNSAQTSC
ncbi:MAG: MmpS family transport accessory protein [Mycobacterium sp.]